MKESDIRPTEILNKFLGLIRKDIKVFFNKSENRVLINCPACNSALNKIVLVKDGFNFVRCNKCETLFCNPRPSLDMLMKFYCDSSSVKFYASEFYPSTEEKRRKLIFVPRVQFIKQTIINHKIKTLNNFADIGAGYGTFLEELIKKKIFNNVYGIEPAKDLARILKNKNINVIECAIEEMPIKFKCYFDFVTSFELFEHLFTKNL